MMTAVSIPAALRLGQFDRTIFKDFSQIYELIWQLKFSMPGISIK